MKRFFIFSILMILTLSFVAGSSLCSAEEKGQILTVTKWSPRGSVEKARPTVEVTIKSTVGSKIDAASIKISIDGNVLANPKITGSGAEVSVSADCTTTLEQQADHDFSVSAKDDKGNVLDYKWTVWVPLIY